MPLRNNVMSRAGSSTIGEILIKQESKNKIHIEERHFELSFRFPPLPEKSEQPQTPPFFLSSIILNLSKNTWKRIDAERTIQKRSK